MLLFITLCHFETCLKTEFIGIVSFPQQRLGGRSRRTLSGTEYSLEAVVSHPRTSLSHDIVSDRKTFKTPRRPYEKERLDAELRLVGEYGLRCKREIWRVQYALAKLRKAARTLLTLEPDDPRRIFDGASLLRRMSRYGLLADDELELDKVLQLTTQKLLERRLQTKVYKQNLAKSIHHARVLIRQRHIRVGSQLVNVPSFNVRTSSEKHIDFDTNSPHGQGPPGRVAKKRAAARAAGGEEE